MTAVRTPRRALIWWASSALLACTPALAQTSSYPSKPVRLVVPFAPGGPVDALARALGAKLMAATGQQFVVENRVGGGSIIAWDAVAKSPADGYTLLVAGVGSRTILPSVATLPFDPAKDLVAVTRLAETANIFVASPASGLKTLADLVARAKANPGQINMANPAPATVTHFAATLLQREAGISFTEVPYKGGAPATNALMAGEVDVMVADIGAVMAQMQGGRALPLAVTTPKRWPMLPAVPTTTELGYAGVVSVNVYGLFAPAGTPKAVVERLGTLSAAAMQNKDLRDNLGKLGLMADTSSAEAFEAYLREQTTKWAPLAKASGLRLN